MFMKMKKRLLSILLSLALVLGLIPGMSLTAYAADATETVAEDIFAEKVIFGNFYTVDENNPRAEAVAILGGHFVYVGDAAGVQELIGKNTKVERYEDGLIIPGISPSTNARLSRMLKSRFFIYFFLLIVFWIVFGQMKYQVFFAKAQYCIQSSLLSSASFASSADSVSLASLLSMAEDTMS